jgi:AraC family transcriptional regulator
VILTEMPDLPPAPRTSRQVEFRREFYRRWGRENCIVSGTTRHAAYGLYRQMLSVKCVARGAETYFLDRRRVTVRDDSYLVLNEGRTYGSLIEAPTPAYSFAIFFRPGLAREVAGGVRSSVAQALDDAADVEAPLEFAEHLRSHDRLVSPVLRLIQRQVVAGARDEDWLEEQCQFLAERLVRAHVSQDSLRRQLAGVRAAKRAEIARRLGWATDFMHAHLDAPIGLREMAAAARLSRFHFLRLFQIAHGSTPAAYLRELRARRALVLMDSPVRGADEIAARVGLSRVSLWRALRRQCGAGIRGARGRSTGAGFLARN